MSTTFNTTTFNTTATNLTNSITNVSAKSNATKVHPATATNRTLITSVFSELFSSNSQANKAAVDSSRHKVTSQFIVFQANSLYSLNLQITYLSTSEFSPLLITINNQNVWMELNNYRTARHEIMLYHLTEINMINKTQSIEIFELFDTTQQRQTSAIKSINITPLVIIVNNKCEINAYSSLFATQTISTSRFNVKNNLINTYEVNTLARDDTKYGLCTSWTFDFKINFPLLTDNILLYITDNDATKFGRLFYNNTANLFGFEVGSEVILIPSITQLNKIEYGYKHIVFTFNNYNKKLSFYINNQFFGEIIVQNVPALYLLYIFGINKDFLTYSNKIKELRYFSWAFNDVSILGDEQCSVSCDISNSAEFCVSKSCVWFSKSEQCLNSIDCKQLSNYKEECNGEIFINNYDLSHLLQSNCYYNKNSKSCKKGNQNYKLETKEIINMKEISEYKNVFNFYHCKTFCDGEGENECRHWEYNKINTICKLFGAGQYVSKMNNNYIHGYPLSITGSLMSHIISSESIENECKSKSMVHIIIQINYALLHGIFDEKIDTFIGGLFPKINFIFGKMSVSSYYGQGGRNIHDDFNNKINENFSDISIYWKDEIVDLGWHCYFKEPITVSMMAKDEFNLIQKDINLFEGVLNIEPLISKKLNSWHSVNIYDKTNDKKNVINGELAMFKACKIDCSSDMEMTIYAKHFITSHSWSYINFEIIFFGQFISTQQHIYGSSWNEKIMFKKICKLHNDIKLNPRILIYENYEPIGRKLWGIVDDLNIDDILSSHIMDDDDLFKNIYVIHSYIKNPTFNGGEYKLQLNVDNESYIPYLKIKIKLSEIHKSCLIPETQSLNSLYGNASMANFGVATLITAVVSIIIVCISIVYFDIKRNSYYKLKKKEIDDQDKKNNCVISDEKQDDK